MQIHAILLISRIARGLSYARTASVAAFRAGLFIGPFFLLALSIPENLSNRILRFFEAVLFAKLLDPGAKNLAWRKMNVVGKSLGLCHSHSFDAMVAIVRYSILKSQLVH